MPPKNLIINGTFDGGSTGWSGNDLETSYRESAYLGNGSSNRVAEMDGRSGQTTVMEQTFTVDYATTTTLTLDVALRNASLGQAGSEGFTVEILDDTGAVIASTTILPTANSFTGYQLPVTFPAAGDYTLRMTELGPDNSLGAIVDTIELMVCFAGETGIETDRGIRRARDIRVGDLVKTSEGLKPVRWIGRREVTEAQMKAEPRYRPVLIRAGALGQGLPLRDLRVSRQHRMLVSTPIARRMFGQAEVLVPAICLVGMPGIGLDEEALEVDYVHLLFDGHEIVFAEGAPSESLYTGAQAWGALSEAAREEIRLIFPELAAGKPRVPAAPIPSRKAQRQLVRRMRKNGHLPLMIGTGR